MDSLYTIRGSARHAARLVALQLLYQKEQTDTSAEEVLRHFEEWFVTDFQAQYAQAKKQPPLALDFMKELVLGVSSQSSVLQEVLARHLAHGWTLDRLPIVLKFLLELGIFELRVHQVPDPVVINEYVGLAKGFFQGPEETFVNGLLDAVSRENRTPEPPQAT